MELEAIQIGQNVGKFLVDILAKDSSRSIDEDNLVCIENQRGNSNHDHLGKCITYGAGIGAKAVIWIAEHFNDEHRQALNWLNVNSGGRVTFFALEEHWSTG